MDAYHVIVKRQNGSLTRSDKEKESSAIKSAKAFINFKDEPAAIVIQNKRVLFSIPEDAGSNKTFLAAAMKKAYSNEPTAAPTKGQPSEKIIVPADRIKALATQYEEEVGTGQVIIPKTHAKADPCTIRILQNACIASSLGQGVPLEAAKLICNESKEDIESLAIKISSGTITLDQAIEELAGAKVEEEQPAAKQPENVPNVSKVMRGRKDKIFPKTRIREDIGKEEEDLNDLKNRSTPDGIIIYTTKESDDGVHEMVAYAMGYTPSSLINSHYPAGIEGYEYRRPIPLMRPSYKVPKWTAFGQRIQNPSLLIQRIQEKFPNESDVKIIIANGVELA